MEYLPRIHHIAALPQSPRVIVKIERTTRKISLDGLSSCRCSKTSHGDLKTMKNNANQVISAFLSMRKDFQQDKGHSSDLDQKRSGIPLMNTVHKQSCRTDDVNICRKQTPSLPIHESIIQRSAQKQRWWKCRWRDG